MKYNYCGKDYKIPDKEVDKLVDSLNISIAEACEVWLADAGEIISAEQEKMNENAKSVRRYERSTTARKKVKKERKIDENKRELLIYIKDTLTNVPECVITGQKTETELHFIFEEEEYTLKLTKHRPKKA